jgi:hypothetical protein
MTVPSLTDVFGAGATQTADSLTISKADLPTLTASAANNGQELLVGILLQAIKKLNTAGRTADPDIKIELTYTGQTVYPGTGGTNDRQDSYTVVLHKDVAQESVDADDY